MRKPRILWVDDEIDILRAHILFLENKDYEVETAYNGADAIEMVKNNFYDIIFLDENMPGLTGLETLTEIKAVSSNVPVVMITKSEEENIMDEAIGSKISDYLIKPVNPKQILLTLKKNIDQKRLVTQQTTSAYQMQFSQIGMRINDRLDYREWMDIYKKLVFWEIELGTSDDNTMDEVLAMQKDDANNSFFKFVRENYLEWLNKDFDERPTFSHDIFKHKVFPLLDAGHKVFVLVIDNLRFDQWRTLSPVFEQYFRVDSDELYMSILPTATMYARNAMFAGMLPAEIEKTFPELWDDDDNEGNKNQHEEELLIRQLKRHRRQEKLYFEKVTGIAVSGNCPKVLKTFRKAIFRSWFSTLWI